MATASANKPKIGLFIFHRDLRVPDNRGLIEATKQCDKVYCCFIFTPEQVGHNIYKSNQAVRFMIESIQSLNTELGGKLILFYGKQTTILADLIRRLKLTTIIYNRDYTPYAVQRDKETRELCERRNIECIETSDYYLFEPGTVLAAGGEAYKKYTPFYNAVIRKRPDAPISSSADTIKRNIIAYTGRLEHTVNFTQAIEQFLGPHSEDKDAVGGRQQAVALLKKATKTQSHYGSMRDYFTYETTRLSPYIKFGCVSVREVYAILAEKYGKQSGIIRELIWREFFAHVLYAYPEVLQHSYLEKYRGIRWSKSAANLERWKRGKTGFPIVDACMRQLNETGYMHNRGRMVVATFLCKTLLLDWHLGEQYFAQRLTDYDPASNNGNWQSISSTGVDNKPYYRDMNPWIQARKFDKDAEYIKRWVPELRPFTARDILNWDKRTVRDGVGEYMLPIVDYDEQKRKMLDMYERAT